MLYSAPPVVQCRVLYMGLNGKYDQALLFSRERRGPGDEAIQLCMQTILVPWYAIS